MVLILLNRQSCGELRLQLLDKALLDRKVTSQHPNVAAVDNSVPPPGSSKEYVNLTDDKSSDEE